MRYFIITPLVCLMIIMTAFSQSDTIAFITIAGGDLSDICHQVIALHDGGYIAVGSTASFGAGSNDIYIVKTDSTGAYLWSKTIGETGIDIGNSIKETYDHGLIITGFTNDYGAQGYDLLIAKTDSSGNLLWLKTYGGADWDFGYSIQQTSDSGFVACGKTYSMTNGGTDVFVIKTDQFGNQQWLKNYGGPNDDIGYVVLVNRDGNFIIGGQTFSFGNGNSEAYLIALSPSGDTLWTKTYAGAGNAIAYGMDTTFDNGIIFTGTTSSIGGSVNSIYLVKTDSVGNLQWNKQYGDTLDNEGRSVVQVNNGGYIVVGTDNNPFYGLGGYGLYIFRTDSVGYTPGGPTFGGAGDEIGYSVVQASNGDIFVGGTTTSYGHGLEDFYLLRFTSDSIIHNYTLDLRVYNDTPSISLVKDYNNSYQYTLYPNPFNELTKIRMITKLHENAVYSIQVYNSEGKAVTAEKNFKNDRIIIFKSGLAEGLYYFIINENNTAILSGKFVIY